MRAYTLPSVTPLTSCWTKNSTEVSKPDQPRGSPQGAARLKAGLLLHELVAPVFRDLEDEEGRVLDVAVLRKGDRLSEDRLLEVRLGHLLEDRLASRLLAALADGRGRLHDDRRRREGGRPERAEVAVLLLEGRCELLDRRVVEPGDVGRERRDVGARDLEVVRREEPVRAEDHGLLALLGELVAEELGVGRHLPGQEDDVRVVGDCRDERGEVRLVLAHGLARDRDAGLLEGGRRRVGEAGRVGALVVDDEHVLRPELLRHVGRVRRALVGVGRDDAEERVEVLRQVRRRRRGGDERHAGVTVDGADRLDLLAAGRADHGLDVAVRDELRRDRRGLRGIELRVALDERERRTALLVELVDRELRPVELLLADRGDVARKRAHDADRRGAVDRLGPAGVGAAGRVLCRRLAVIVVAAAAGRDDRERRDQRQQKPKAGLPHSLSSSSWASGTLYAIEGSPAGWKTPRTLSVFEPTFSRMCGSRGGK